VVLVLRGVFWPKERRLTQPQGRLFLRLPQTYIALVLLPLVAVAAVAGAVLVQVYLQCAGVEAPMHSRALAAVLVEKALKAFPLLRVQITPWWLDQVERLGVVPALVERVAQVIFAMLPLLRVMGEEAAELAAADRAIKPLLALLVLLLEQVAQTVMLVGQGALFVPPIRALLHQVGQVVEHLLMLLMALVLQVKLRVLRLSHVLPEQQIPFMLLEMLEQVAL